MKRGDIDFTGKLGPLYPVPNPAFGPVEWPMYSFTAPSHTVWNAIANALIAKGWTEEEVRMWLQSKNARYAMDGLLNDLLDDTARAFVRHTISDRDKVTE